MKKRIFAIFLLLMALCDCSAFAATRSVYTEHLKVNKEVAKKTPTNIVLTSPTLNTVIEYNVLQIEFAQDFSTKTAKVGDRVGFLIKGGLRTQEGTALLPDGSQIEAEVVSIEKPKSFNRSGKVVLSFDKVVLPDGSKIDLGAKLYSKKDYLSRGKLNALGKGLGTTLGAGAIATGAGCGIGAAAGAVIVGGFAIGLPVGIAVGALAGLCTPGLHYKAKPGDKIYIQLTDNLDIEK
ncbi:MAG: hypothetical protein K6C94_06940 [Candidatus Gastranaerophilales bacterium]|nr:hypothetical protein [Candidatus Gastranaerophilales bacterium]